VKYGDAPAATGAEIGKFCYNYRMKKIMMQLFRTIVTVIIMSVMAVMIFTTSAERDRALVAAKEASARATLAETRLEAMKSAQDDGVFVLCRFDLKDTVDIGDYVAKTLSVVPQVRAEDGCRLYTLLEDAQTDWTAPMRFGERTFWMVEKWDSIDALKAHLETPHMKAFGPTVRDMRKGMTFHVLQSAAKKSR
jgi:quinol monooxygenase YgiN